MYVTVVYNRILGNFKIESNIKENNINSFIIDWIKTDIGKCQDKRPVISKDVYVISIHQDIFGQYDIEDNCSNRDLRRGILGYFIRDYKNLLKSKQNEN